MADKHNDPTERKIAELPIIRNEHYRTAYADQVRLGVSPWDFRLTFGVIVEPEPKVPASEDIITILMSPQHTKALLRILSKQVEKWETEHGAIKAGEDTDYSLTEDGEKDLSE